MAKKKFGKFLLFSAVAGAVAAGAYYYFQNKNIITKDDSDEDDDFDDFSEESDNSHDSSNASKRSYVSLDFENTDNTSFEDSTAREAMNNLDKAAESAKAEVEEFFDEDEEENLKENE